MCPCVKNTGEAGLTDEGSESGCSAADHILRSLILKNSTSKGFHFIAQDKVKELCKKVDDLELPMNPLDELVDRLGGPKRVAEMTGRSTRQVCEHGDWVLEKRLKTKDSEDALNIQERKKFMAGN